MKATKKVSLRKNQIPLKNKITEGFNKNNRVLLYALCGVGKTILALSVIEDIVKSGKRVAVSTYGRAEIRKHWYEKIKNYSSDLLKDLQIVCSKEDAVKLNKLKIHAVSNGEVSDTKLFTIFIPQTINPDSNTTVNSIDPNSKLGKFDYIIIDEAHEFLETSRADNEDGRLKRIINTYSHKKTKYLGLTGTGFELIQEGKFFHKSELVIYDVVDALGDKAIVNCESSVEYFKFTLPSDCYNSSEELTARGAKRIDNFFRKDGLNNKGKNLLKKRSFFSKKIESLLGEIKKGEKVLVILPKGLNCIEGIANTISMCDKGAAVIKNSKIDKNLRDSNEEEFKNSPKTNFLLVVDMCGTGWDFPKLDVVIDLTFTRNPKVMIQRLARGIRTFDSKIKSRYIYAVDQSVGAQKAQFYLARAMMLTARSQILGGDINRVNLSLLNNQVSLDDLTGEPTRIAPISLLDMQACETGQRKNCGEISFEDVIAFEKNTVREILIKNKIYHQIKQSDVEDVINFIMKEHEEKDDYILLDKFKKEFPLIYKKAFAKKSSKEIIREIKALRGRVNEN
jgi:superfamily II DNA or RNA helicase